VSNYAWIIDRDCLSIPGHEDDEAGTIGPRDAHPVAVRVLQENPKVGRQFRMFDDGNIMLYEGRIVTKEAYLDNGSVTLFEPLDDFGRPNAGATYIKYRNKHKWEVL
jgi:hypothetical protein